MIDAIENVFLVDENIEKCIGQALRNAGISYPIVYHGDNTAVGEGQPWIHVHVAQGESDPQAVRQIGQYEFPERWSVTITITINAYRSGDHMPREHVMALARYAMFNYQFTLNSDVSPDYQIAFLRDAGTSYSIEQDKRLDVTELTFQADAFVRTTAWPQSF